MAGQDDSSRQRVRFFYLKSPSFRVVHVDGAIGGITPRGLIHMSVYSERAAIPQSIEHELSDEGNLSGPINVEGKPGIVRDVDADLIMSKHTAIEMRGWLDERIADLERLEGSASTIHPGPSTTEES